MKKRNFTSVILYVLILAMVFSLLFSLFGGGPDELKYSELIALFENQQVKSFSLAGENMHITLHTPYNGKLELRTIVADPQAFREDMSSVLQMQKQTGILESYDYIPGETTSPWDFVLPIIVAGLVIVIVWVFLAGRASQKNPMANFGKARTGHGQAGGKKVTFADVAGVDEEKAELQEVVDFLRNPKKFADIGAKIPHGIDFVNEDDGRRHALGLIKQVTDTAGAHAHIQLHKVRTGNGQKLHTGLTGHRTGKQGLTGTGRAHQQQAMGDPGTDLPELLRIPEEIYHFL